MDLDFTQSTSNGGQFMKGEICNVQLPDKPKIAGDNEGILCGSRPCIVLATLGYSAYILPLTSSKSYADLGFRIRITPFSFSYPRFDMVMPVSYNQLKHHEKGYNIIVDFGQEFFDEILSYFNEVMNGKKPYYCEHMIANNSNSTTVQKKELHVETKDFACHNNSDTKSVPVIDFTVDEDFHDAIERYDEYLKTSKKVLSPSIAKLELELGQEAVYKKVKELSSADLQREFSIGCNIASEIRIRYGIGKRKTQVSRINNIIVEEEEEELTDIVKNASGITKRYKYNSSTIGGSSILDFLNTKTITKEATSITSTDLFNAYKNYSLKHGYQYITRKNFDVYLKSAGLVKELNSSGKDIYRNIQLL